MRLMTQDARVAHVQLALYAGLRQRIRACTTAKFRRTLEDANAIVWFLSVALLVLLHVSFVYPTAPSPPCLASFLPPATPSPVDVHLLRIQIVEPSRCASHLCTSSSAPLASFVFASHRRLLDLRDSGLLHAQYSPSGLPLVVVPRSDACFSLRGFGASSPLWVLLLDTLLGYDTIVVNHLMRWRGVGGVVRNERSGQVFHVGPGQSGTQHPVARLVAKVPWLARLMRKIETLYSCIALFFLGVTTVGLVGHELIAHSLTFSDLVFGRNQFRSHAQHVQALGLQCAQTLVLIPIAAGIALFFVEMYHQDRILTLGVLEIFTAGESFSIFCARSPLSRRYFPWLFFCWFSLFHIYQSAYPSGFSHLALLVYGITMAHTMTFFANCFELPDTPSDRPQATHPR